MKWEKKRESKEKERKKKPCSKNRKMRDYLFASAENKELNPHHTRVSYTA